jgi:hypothetical protein
MGLKKKYGLLILCFMAGIFVDRIGWVSILYNPVKSLFKEEPAPIKREVKFAPFYPDYIEYEPTPYKKGLPLYTDRVYFEEIGDPRLEGLVLLQIRRHLQHDFFITTEKPLTVYRFLSDENDNSVFSDWGKTDIPIKVKGNWSTFTKVVKKDFPAGTFKMTYGGPLSAAPVLLDLKSSNNDMSSFKVSSLPE